jgi:hypothetical protein
MKFRKKPVEIEAVQFTKNHWEVGETLKAFDEMPNWLFEAIKNLEIIPVWTGSEYLFEISTLEGKMRCNLGDWIIKGIKGEFYPCKPDIFNETYEKI